MTPAALLVVARTTLLFLSGLAFLRLSKRTTPAQRHLLCLSVLGGSLAVLLAIFLPRPLIVIDVPVTVTFAAAGDPSSKGGPWAQIAAIAWACGCACVALRFVFGCATLSRIRRSAMPLASGIFAADVSVPMLTGLARPVILMPRAAADWPESQCRAAIRHELAHLERGDLRTNIVAAAACAIYWFHPLVWILAWRLREEQEAACDDAVIQSGLDRTEYAEALLEIARAAADGFAPSCPMSDREGVKARIVRLLSSNTQRPVRSAPNVALAGVLFALVAVGLVGPERIYNIGGGVTTPAVTKKVDPGYTEAARKAGIHGMVLLKLVVGSDGIARDIVLEKGIDSGLDRNAIQAIRQWRFKPATRNAIPVATTARVQINFRLL